MQRAILDEQHIHPAIAQHIATLNRDMVQVTQSAIDSNAVVVVGMGMNPVPKKARKLLDEQGIPYRYLEYGNYLSQWRRRNALKMWTGWPSFPMIFVRGVLVGGASDLKALMLSGDLKKMLAA